ncbi:MAG TPA: hypothetical protein VN700_09335 [Vicinamibacterales bacterium]|nr:hypothetical protein [Vicinamibacterales bacterium]
MPPTRREFLAVLAATVPVAAGTARGETAQNGLDKFLLPAPPCKDDLTPAVLGTDYRPGAPVRSSLIDPGETGTRMTLAGYVTGLTCGRIKGARVDFWQAGPDGKLQATGFRLRGAVLTDAEGRYSLTTVVPGALAGRARRIGVRIAPAGKKPLATVLFFPDDSVAARDSQFKPALVMKKVAGAENAYGFDFLLDA